MADDISMGEALRRYKKQRKDVKKRLSEAGGVNVDDWEYRTKKSDAEITKPFTPQGKALREEEKRRKALERMARGGK